jgi:GT2 family glycosyltransferase
MRKAISVLILAHNKAAYTRRCLNALLLSTARPLQVVLVNNGSSDDTAEVFAGFKQAAARAGVVAAMRTFKENVGAIEGRNAAAELLRGDYWVFLDNDVVARTRSWLERLRALLGQGRGVGGAPGLLGVVAPKLVYANAPHDIQCAGCAVTKGGRVIFSGRGEARLAPAWNAARDCQTLISACWMMPAAVWREVGPLDPRFSPVQFEDIDYCYRIREAGHRCRYEPAIEMYHFENVTTGRTESLNYTYLTVKNGMKFKEKWQHRFATEDGPPDADWQCSKVPQVGLEDVPEDLETLP